MRRLLVVLDFGTSLALTLFAWSFDMFHRIREVNLTLVDAESLRRMSRCQDLEKTLLWIANPSIVNRCERNRNVLILWHVAC
ncbi:hypothetical protein DEU56DRAFT_832604 [Suillus clintonianus]|uniref:uncharacterized protein n=1 Tax=Suillus clintonianus TaxID=1904413 RepID=UPI001B86D644|nr:uncharacterized protein DEU56DRAFT_832604 [Suillus clintonianus]KAG2122212.1 hypothetical protein DEU56DRAFT_832604 [Suillus clintonianus]